MMMDEFSELPIDATAADLKKWTKGALFVAGRRCCDEANVQAEMHKRRASRFADDERAAIKREVDQAETARSLVAAAENTACVMARMTDDLHRRDEEIVYLKGVIDGLRGSTKPVGVENELVTKTGFRP